MKKIMSFVYYYCIFYQLIYTRKIEWSKSELLFDHNFLIFKVNKVGYLAVNQSILRFLIKTISAAQIFFLFVSQ